VRAVVRADVGITGADVVARDWTFDAVRAVTPDAETVEFSPRLVLEITFPVRGPAVVRSRTAGADFDDKFVVRDATAEPPDVDVGAAFC